MVNTNGVYLSSIYEILLIGGRLIILYTFIKILLLWDIMGEPHMFEKFYWRSRHQEVNVSTYFCALIRVKFGPL